MFSSVVESGSNKLVQEIARHILILENYFPNVAAVPYNIYTVVCHNDYYDYVTNKLTLKHQRLSCWSCNAAFPPVV